MEADQAADQPGYYTQTWMYLTHLLIEKTPLTSNCNIGKQHFKLLLEQYKEDMDNKGTFHTPWAVWCICKPNQSVVPFIANGQSPSSAKKESKGRGIKFLTFIFTETN